MLRNFSLYEQVENHKRLPTYTYYETIFYYERQDMDKNSTKAHALWRRM